MSRQFVSPTPAKLIVVNKKEKRSAERRQATTGETFYSLVQRIDKFDLSSDKQRSLVTHTDWHLTGEFFHFPLLQEEHKSLVKKEGTKIKLTSQRYFLTPKKKCILLRKAAFAVGIYQPR